MHVLLLLLHPAPQLKAVHSADGLAVGAAVHGGNAQLNTVVALAMILHKAPAALGLTTFLIAARWSRARTIRGLMAFASASPIAAIATAVLLSLSPFLSSTTGAALCVIFSGGTFLYASCMHVLPEAKEAGPGGKLSRCGCCLRGVHASRLKSAKCMAAVPCHAMPMP